MVLPHNWPFWVGFMVFVLVMLALDLGVFNRRAHTVKFREAMGWTAVWISLAGAFAVLVYLFGHQFVGESTRPNHVLMMEFITGYLVEESLSIDNLFVFLLVFRYFKVPGSYQHKVLFWGILGALIMRAIFIFAGVALINRFHWIIYVFGAFLIYIGIRLFGQQDSDVNPEKNPLVKFFRKYVRMTPDYVGGNFFVRQNGINLATPLVLVLIVVETTDIVFAVDSIPAILAITREPFIVFTSNVFAIMGLRSLYFALAGMMDLFHLLHYGLATILIFIGVKMLGSHWFEIPIAIALGVVVGVLAVSIGASVLFPPKRAAA
jgi:tellurite resistance protein TerC